ncbi:MAG: AsmA-like C-terminal region-containing protein [Kiritimatiellae bacterium]|nr:AsmA-like C-terminal region-containing protein [Kiritimatiellia bacterium]
MWKFLKCVGAVLKAAFWLLALLVGALFLALYVLDRGIPSPILSRLSSALSNDDVHVRIDRASFSLKNGLRLHRVKALPKRIAAGALVSADEVCVNLSFKPGLPLNERVQGVSFKNIALPSLPPPGMFREKKDPEPRKEMPDLAPFPLSLEAVNILGIKADQVSAMVNIDSNRILVSDLSVKWPDKAFDMSVNGHATLDLSNRTVTGKVAGQALPHNIVPLLQELRARGAVKQIEYFSDIKRPVNADFDISVNIDNSDFAFNLDLDVGPCAYRGVPVEFAKGRIVASETNANTVVVIHPLSAKSSTGPVSGRLVYREETEGLDLEADAEMAAEQLLDIINILNRGELDRIRFLSSPTLSAKGLIALSSQESSVTNDITGKLGLGKATVLNLPLNNLAGDLSVTGYTANISNVTGTTDSGGKVSGGIFFSFPEYAASATVFNANVTLAKVALDELSQAFNVTNARSGWVSGNIQISGPTSGKTVPQLSGAGKVRISDGLIHRMKIFAGLTDYLTRNIPGLSAVVNQSSGSMDFTITNGVLHTENLLIEGNVFSIKGRGHYNLDTDQIEFVVRANIFRQRTIAGRITHFLSLPFSRMLLEFRVFGTLEDPDWSYVNIIERITDQFSGPPKDNWPPTSDL